MGEKTILEKLRSIGIIPVAVIDDPDKATPLAEALARGGLSCMEVTFRTAGAEESIRRVAAEAPDVLVGAGTILTVHQAKTAVEAGARFIVSPGFNREVVGYCVDQGIPVTPGIQTPTEIELALSFGLKVVKFFPAEPAGGLKTLKALSGPYVDISFIPTGGLNADNAHDYLTFDRVWACGGSWIARRGAINENRFDEISSIAGEARKIVDEVRGRAASC